MQSFRKDLFLFVRCFVSMQKSVMKKNGYVVLLTATPKTILERVKENDDRPLLKNHKNVEYIAELMEKRREKYENGRKSRKNFFTLIGILGVMLLFLPHIGISVDSIMSGSMEPVLRTGGIVFTDTKERRPELVILLLIRSVKPE